MPSSDLRKNWDYGQVDLTATSTVYKVTNLHGGESITIKALVGNSGNAYIGADKLLTTSNGFELDSSDSVTLTLPLSFGRDHYIEIYAVTDNAGDDICYVKLIDTEVETSTG